MTDFSWRLKRAIRGLRKTAYASYSNKAAANTSPLCTRTDYVARVPGNFSSVHYCDHRGIWLSRPDEHWTAARAFSRYGPPDEGARTGAAQFLCRWAWPPFAGCRNGSDWLRNAEGRRKRAASCRRRTLVASTCGI